MEESTNAPAGAGAGSCLPLGTLPVLVYDHGLDPNRQTAFAIGDRSLHTSVVPELYDYYHVTPRGWVLLVALEPSPSTRLWDPRSGESVALPAMERELPDYWKCYLSDAPTAASCVVLVLNTGEPSFLYCRVGDSCWSAHDYEIGDKRLPPLPAQKIVIQDAAAVDGKFYFKETAKLGVIDFSTGTPELSYLECRRAEYPEGSNIRRDYMVESRGELFFAVVFLEGFTPEVMTVRVYRVDLSGPRLIEVDELGDRVFLLSSQNAQALCSASKYGLKGNRVYFVHNPTEEPDGGFLGIYDMEAKSLEKVQPCPGMGELLRSPFWVLPTDDDQGGLAD